MKSKIKYISLIFIAFFININLYATDNESTNNPSIEIKDFIQENAGLTVDVSIIPNDDTKKGDLYIKVINATSPSRNKNIFLVVKAIGKLMEESIAYSIYLGIVMIEINGNMYAISAENCHKIFNAPENMKGQILQRSLKKLK